MLMSVEQDFKKTLCVSKSGENREDVVKRQARLQENARRQRRRRDSEGVEERQARLRENAQRQQARRESEGVEERQARLRENAQRQRARRESENVVERQMRLQEGLQRQMRRRQRESSEGRRTRLQSNAQIQQRRRASETMEGRELRSQAEAMRLQRRREFESTEARALRQQEDTQRHRRRRTQESERERSVRLQSNALANRQRRSRLPESTGAALLSRITEVNYLGELNRRCVNCGALHFPCVAKTSHPGKFRECCDLGRFTLNVFESFPEQLRRLFVRGPDSTEEFRRMQRNFLENIRNFNSALAMASMGAQVETLQGRGPCCYRIHGQVYHRLGPLHPRDGEPRQYGQIYILDTELAAQERLGDVRNSECEPGFMRFLSGLLASVNVYAQSYKMMYEVEQMEIAMAKIVRQPIFVWFLRNVL
uniref:Helitron_like_N domain-containing protein n=1 Tax=Haemonchus contortus TaxID=6289 RepID=A0A7I5EB03_HAECO